MSHEGSADESGAIAESPKTPMASRATSVERTVIESSLGAGAAGFAAVTGGGGGVRAEVALAETPPDCWIADGVVGSGDRAGVGVGVAGGCEHAAASAAAAIVRIGYLATTILQTLETAIRYVSTRASAHGDMITENPVSCVQNGHGCTATRIGLGKVAADEPIVLSVFTNRNGDEHEVRVEGANVLYTEELELERALGEIIEGTKRRFSSNAKIPEGTGLAKRFAIEKRALPLQRDFSGALARRRARKAEIRELDSFAPEVDRGLGVRA